MESDQIGIPHPKLSVSDNELDFGVYSGEDVSIGKGMAVLTVSNTGDMILVGRIAAQVPWIDIDPPDFRLAPGESSEHIFRLKKTLSAFKSSSRISQSFIALINSNGGSETIGGFYFTSITGKKQPEEKPLKLRTFFYIFLVCLLAAGIVFGIIRLSTFEADRNRQNEIVQVYTQAAEQYMTKVAMANPTATSAPLRDYSSDPEMMQAMSPEPTTTMTPWPSDAFPNPEEFVRSYYDDLNNKDYNSAWWKMSENLQQLCCYQAGAQPYDIFVAGWADTESVEVTYAYLQEYNTNPAELTVGLIYHYADSSTEMNYKIYVISDAARNTLLIDSIEQ